MDVDGSGSIDFDEFKRAILLKGGLIFEDSLLKNVMEKFDDDGSGQFYIKMMNCVLKMMDCVLKMMNLY